MKKSVSRRALIARINRALAPRGEALRKSTARMISSSGLGEFYVHDVSRNAVAGTYFPGLEDLGRELGVLGSDEVVNG